MKSEQQSHSTPSGGNPRGEKLTHAPQHDAPQHHEPEAPQGRLQAKAKREGRQLGSQAEQLASAGVGHLQQQLRGLATALDTTCDELESQNHAATPTVRALKGRVRDGAEYLGESNPRQMFREVERFAQDNPALFLGACFTGGVALARLLRASPPNAETSRASRRTSSGPERGRVARVESAPALATDSTSSPLAPTARARAIMADEEVG